MLLRIIIPLCFIHAFCFADGFRVDLLHMDFTGGPLAADTAGGSPLADGCAIEIVEDFGPGGVVPIMRNLQPHRDVHNSEARKRDEGLSVAVNGAARFDAPGYFMVESVMAGADLPRHALRFRVWNEPEPALATAYWESPAYRVLSGSQQVSYSREEWTFHRVSSANKNNGNAMPDVTPVAAADEYDLLTAYPNPFNSRAQIVFSLEHAASVELSVYDLQGRHERTLLSGSQSAGQHRIAFDGSALPTGVYFISLRTDNRAPITRKLVLMR